MSKTPQTLSSMALHLLRERIISGELRPGAKLSDLVLSREIGISRTPLREAIRQLAADGLVDIVPHQGATVRAPSGDELDELYEIRGLLEGHAAARAATHRSAAQVDELWALCTAMEAIVPPASGDTLTAEGTKEQREIDLGFHRRVLALSGLTRLQRLVEDAGIIARPFETMDELLTVAQLASAQRHHRAIAQAIADGDAERARAAMTAHIEEGRHGIHERRAAWQENRVATVPEALRRFVR
jgi:DNA-binding GntR family transcriptional regulator